MKILLNNNTELLSDEKAWTIQDLIELKKYSFRLLVVKINDSLVPKQNYATTTVQEGDNVMILHLMSGG